MGKNGHDDHLSHKAMGKSCRKTGKYIANCTLIVQGGKVKDQVLKTKKPKIYQSNPTGEIVKLSHKDPKHRHQTEKRKKMD